MNQIRKYNLRHAARAAIGLTAMVVAFSAGQGRPASAQTSHYKNGLAATPAMGWSSWSALRKGGISDSVIRAEANVMHAQLQSHGYVYINIDDGWYLDSTQSCDAYGRLVPDPAKFPNGIKALADYVHSLGLKLGIYEKPDIPRAAVTQNTPILGTSYHADDIVAQPAGPAWPAPQLDLGTDAINWGSPGAQAYINSCAAQLASWGVDYVKLDWVNSTVNLNTDLPAWSNALLNSGRPIYFSISNYLQVQPPYGATIALYSNGWRNNPDVETYNGANPDGFNLPITDWSHVTAATRLANGQQQTETSLAGPGGWNDEDSLEMGWGPVNTGLTPSEQQYMYAYWCITTSPLLLGCDLTQINANDLAVLQNDEIIACDQAPFELTYGHSANQNAQFYWKPSGDGGVYLMFDNILNPADPGNPLTVSVNFTDLGLSGAQPVRDLFARTTLGTMTSLSESLAGHSAMLFKIGGNQSQSSAPSNVVAVGGNTTVSLSWNAVSGASGYNVYRNGTQIVTSTTSLGYTDTGLVNGTTYSYNVSAIVGGSEGPKSTTVLGTPQGAVNPVNGVYNVTNVLSNLALDDPAGGGIGTKIDQQSATNSNQQWSITGVGGGYYSIKSAGGLALGAPTTNTQLVLEASTGANEQTWSFISSGNNVVIVNKSSGFVVDVAGGSGSPGAVVDSWGANGGPNQSWSLNAVSTSSAPSAPTNLTATPGNAQVSLSWSASSGATSYNLYRNGTKVQSGLSATTFVDSGLTNGTTYTYQVTAVNSSGESSTSNSVSATPTAGTSVPSPPTGLAASAGNAQVSLNWTASAGATSYNVYRNNVKVASGLTATSYTDTGLTNGTTYTYAVTAVNSAGESAQSGSVTATPTNPVTIPAAPTGLTATGGNGQVSLSWTASSGATSYNVYRGTSAGGESGTAVVTGVTGTSYVNTGLTNGAKYYFTVKAVNSAGTSGASNEANATPTAITGPLVLSGSASSHVVTLTWTSTVPNVSYFTVFRGTTPGGEGTTPLDYPSSSPWQDNFSPVPGTTYYYVIRANDIYGNVVGPSNEVSVTP